MLFFETSAKTAEHVGDSFMGVTHELVKNLEKNQVKKKTEVNHGMSLGGKNQAKTGRTGCCY